MLPVFMNLLRRFYGMRAGARSAQRSTIGAGSMPHIHISLSHDGSIASAVVTISVE